MFAQRTRALGLRKNLGGERFDDDLSHFERYLQENDICLAVYFVDWIHYSRNTNVSVQNNKPGDW